MKTFILAIASIGILISNSGCSTQDRMNNGVKSLTHKDEGTAGVKTEAQVQASPELDQARAAEEKKNAEKAKAEKEESARQTAERSGLAVDPAPVKAVVKENKIGKISCRSFNGTTLGEMTGLMDVFATENKKTLKTQLDEKYVVNVKTTRDPKAAPGADYGSLLLTVSSKDGRVVLAQSSVVLNSDLIYRLSFISGKADSSEFTETSCNGDTCTSDTSLDVTKSKKPTVAPISLKSATGTFITESPFSKIRVTRQEKLAEIAITDKTAPVYANLHIEYAPSGSSPWIGLTYFDGINTVGAGCSTLNR